MLKHWSLIVCSQLMLWPEKIREACIGHPRVHLNTCAHKTSSHPSPQWLSPPWSRGRTSATCFHRLQPIFRPAAISRSTVMQDQHHASLSIMCFPWLIDTLLNLLWLAGDSCRVSVIDQDHTRQEFISIDWHGCSVHRFQPRCSKKRLHTSTHCTLLKIWRSKIVFGMQTGTILLHGDWHEWLSLKDVTPTTTTVCSHNS